MMPAGEEVLLLTKTRAPVRETIRNKASKGVGTPWILSMVWLIHSIVVQMMDAKLEANGLAIMKVGKSESVR